MRVRSLALEQSMQLPKWGPQPGKLNLESSMLIVRLSHHHAEFFNTVFKHTIVTYPVRIVVSL